MPHSRTRTLPALLAFFVVVAFAALPPAPAAAAAALARTQAPGYYRMMLGDFEVTVLNDGFIDLPVDQLLKQPPAKTQAAVARQFLAIPLETSVNGFLVNTGSKLVLIDTGTGGGFGPTAGRLVQNLQAAGYRPEQVDDIFITHFHGDHVGGLAANGQPVFPNAVVHADKRESGHFLSQAAMDKAPADAQGTFKRAMEQLKPYVDAGRFQAFDASAEIVPGVRSWETPGHTPGHSTYVVQSKDRKMIVTGDLIHVAAVQFDDPTVTIEFDADRPAAEKQRLAVFAQAAKEGALIAGAHLQFPGLGHLRTSGRGYQFVPVNYTQPR
jgi:glyoxylase-like metal-dependent hydrolase (beta-lactamase superfamily II)